MNGLLYATHTHTFGAWIPGLTFQGLKREILRDGERDEKKERGRKRREKKGGQKEWREERSRKVLVCAVWRRQQKHILRDPKVTKSGFQPWWQPPLPPPPLAHNSIRKPVSHCPPESAIPTPGLSRCHRGSLQEGHKPNPWHNLGVRLCLGTQKKRPGILASRSSWCLLEWHGEPAGWGRYHRGSTRVYLCISVSHRLFLPLSPAVLLKEGPFSLKSPRRLTSGWGCSVLGSFSFSVFLVSASKKPLPPTPEDNRVSETFSAEWGWAHCCGLLEWHAPTCIFPACPDSSDPLWRQYQ